MASSDNPDSTLSARDTPQTRSPPEDSPRYQLGEEVSEGSFGRVFAARDRRLGREVAIKQLRFRGDSIEERFQREVKITARLQHPSIVPIYDVGTLPSGELFYAMKLISGRSLREVVGDAATLDQRLALLPHVLSAAEAIAYAHAQKVIHRDLKPANIMVGPFGETLVIDWGLAKILDESELVSRSLLPGSAAPELTQAGDVVGTPSFMPPEQAAGNAVDVRADVYALGAVLYYVLAGSPPYEGRDSAEVLRTVREAPPTPLEQREPGVPTELGTIVNKAMAREAWRRYPSAGELAEELRRFQTGQLVRAHRYSRGVLVRRWLAQNRRLVAVAAVALAAMAGTGVVSVKRVVVERDVARNARTTAESRRDDLLLAQARLLVEKRPTEALAYLKSYASSRADWPAVWSVAADARSRIVARHVFSGLKATRLSPDGLHVAGLAGDQLVLADALAGTGVVLRQGGPKVSMLALADSALAAVTADHQVTLWDLASRAARPLGKVDEEIMRLAISADGKRVAASGASGALYLFGAANGRTILRGHSAPARSITFSADNQLLASAGDDHSTRVWSLGDGKERYRLDVPGESCAFSADGHLLAVSALDKLVWLLDLRSGQRRSLAGHNDSVCRVRFSRSGRTLYSSSVDGTIRIWDLDQGTSRVLGGDEGTVDDITLSADERLLASASGEDQTVRVWDLALGDSLTLRGYRDAVQAMAFTSDGRSLVTTDFGGGVRVWQPPPPPQLAPIGGPMDALVPAPDGQFWAMGAGRLRRISREGRAEEDRDRAGENEPIATSHDLSVFATAGPDSTVLLFHAGTTAPMVLKGHQGRINVLAFSTDGTTLASGGYDRVIRVWRTSDGSLLRTLAKHDKNVWVLELSPDGKRLASAAGDEHRLLLWDLTTGAVEELPSSDTGKVSCAAFSPDGKSLAWAGGDGLVRVWSAAGLRQLAGHTAQVYSVLFAPDSQHLFSGSADHTARIWSLADGSSKLLEHDGPVILLRLSGDGNTLLTSGNHSVHLWDHAHAAELGVFRPVKGAPADAAISADGRTLAVLFEREPFVRVWPLLNPPPQASLAWLDQLTSVTLTANNEILSPLVISR